MSFEQEYYEAPVFWDGDALLDSSNVLRIKRIVEMVPNIARTLADIGCGNGRFGDALAHARPTLKVIGFDRSTAALSHVTFEKVQGDITSLPFDDRSFDCVSCLEVIEHLPVPIYQPALSEICRIAKDYVIIGVPVGERLDNNQTTCPSCLSRFNVDLHFRSYTADDMPDLLGKDFEMVSTIYPMARPRRVLLDDVLQRIAKLRAPRPGFLSPICPLCGFSDGDTAAIESNLASGIARNTPGGFKGTLLRNWPTYIEEGCCIAALYERRN